MRVTSKGQVTIPVEVRAALGIRTGSNVAFELDVRGARLVVAPHEVDAAIAAMRGRADTSMTTEEILALTRS